MSFRENHSPCKACLWFQGSYKENREGLVEGWMIAWRGGYWQNHDAEEVVLINWICVYIMVSWAQDTWLPQCALAKLRDTSLGGDQINSAFKVRPLRFEYQLNHFGTSLVAQMEKCLPTVWETQVQSLGGEDLLEKEMVTHSSTLAWKIPWEKPGRL